MVEVTQADREAAAAYWKVSRIGNAGTQRRYLSGEADNSFIVQAFARHRHQARAEVVGEIVAWLRIQDDPSEKWALQNSHWYADEIEAKFGGRDET